MSYTLNTIDRHAVCFRKACKPSADGKGERWEQSDQSNTLNGFEFHSDVRTPEAVCYIIDPLSSNSMKSSNPHSGIHPTDVCKCLDTQCLNPSCNQGGNRMLRSKRKSLRSVPSNGCFRYAGNQVSLRLRRRCGACASEDQMNDSAPMIYDARGNGQGGYRLR